MSNSAESKNRAQVNQREKNLNLVKKAQKTKENYSVNVKKKVFREGIPL